MNDGQLYYYFGMVGVVWIVCFYGILVFVVLLDCVEGCDLEGVVEWVVVFVVCLFEDGEMLFFNINMLVIDFDVYSLLMII